MDDNKNKFGYAFLAFCDNDELSRKKAKPIVEYGRDGLYHWYELKHDKTTQRPYLGKRLPEVDEFDDDAQDVPESEEHSSNEEAISEAKKDANIIRNSPIYAPPILENPLPNPFSKLMTTMSTATTVQTATTSMPTGTAQKPQDAVKSIWHKAFGRTPGGNPGGNPGGSGGGGSGGGGAANQQVVPAGGDVRLMGALPNIFNGNHAEAHRFIEAVKSYIRLNEDVPGFQSPMKKVALTLTLMQGENIAAWVEAAGRTLDNLDPATQNIPAVWDYFVEEFEQQYIDTQAPERARVALESLKMKPPLIDEYIAKFEDLCRKAGYTVGSSEVTYQFLKGLPKHILEDVVKGPQTGNFTELKQRAIQVTRSQELLNNILKQQSSNTTYIPRPQFQPQGFRGGTFVNFQRNFQGNPNRTFSNQQNPNRFNSSNAPRSMNNVPVPMDIGRTRAFRGRGRGGGNNSGFWRTNAANANMDRPRRKAEPGDTCFRCGGTGHWARSKECPMAQINLIDLKEPGQNTSDQVETDTRPMMAQQLKEALYTMNEEEKAQLIQEMGSQEDFPSV